MADLFRPPLEILFKGSYEKSLAFATRSKRWLLVNVQDPGIFDCQLLNRDTWSDEGVKKLIKTSFVMIQLYVLTDQASEYTYVGSSVGLNESGRSQFVSVMTNLQVV